MNPYPHRFQAGCPTCGWRMTAYDSRDAERAAEVHGWLKEGHVAVASAMPANTDRKADRP